MPRFDEELSAEEWAVLERYDAREYDRSEELRARYREDLPSLEPGPECTYCGEPCPVDGYCDPCSDRIATEKRIESGNRYRQMAQLQLELTEVRRRAAEYLRGKR